MYRYNGNEFHWNMDSTWNTSNTLTMLAFAPLFLIRKKPHCIESWAWYSISLITCAIPVRKRTSEWKSIKNSRKNAFYGIENVQCIALCTWVADRLWLYFKLVVRTPYIFTLQLKRLICPMQPWKLLGFWLHQIITKLNRVCECSVSGESTFLDSIQLNCNEICLHLGVFGYLWKSAVHRTYTLHYKWNRSIFRYNVHSKPHMAISTNAL